MPLASLLDWAPAFALVLARVGAAIALLPGLGERVAPATVRIGLALSITILLLPNLQPISPAVPDSGLQMALMVAGEVMTGLWFGWLARMIALALPIGAQIIAYLIGLSSVLQPDSELGSQSTALGKLFELAAPMLILVLGLYTLPLTALDGLFHLIPPRPHAACWRQCRGRASCGGSLVRPGFAARLAVRGGQHRLAYRSRPDRPGRIAHTNLLCIDAGPDPRRTGFADDHWERDHPCLAR
jgi:hypothetical protein